MERCRNEASPNQSESALAISFAPDLARGTASSAQHLPRCWRRSAAHAAECVNTRADVAISVTRGRLSAATTHAPSPWLRCPRTRQRTCTILTFGTRMERSEPESLRITLRARRGARSRRPHACSAQHLRASVRSNAQLIRKIVDGSDSRHRFARCPRMRHSPCAVLRFGTRVEQSTDESERIGCWC